MYTKRTRMSVLFRCSIGTVYVLIITCDNNLIARHIIKWTLQTHGGCVLDAIIL